MRMSNSTGSDWNVVTVCTRSLWLVLVSIRGSYEDVQFQWLWLNVVPFVLVLRLDLDFFKRFLCGFDPLPPIPTSSSFQRIPTNSHSIFWIFLFEFAPSTSPSAFRVSYEDAFGSDISIPICWTSTFSEWGCPNILDSNFTWKYLSNSRLFLFIQNFGIDYAPSKTTNVLFLSSFYMWNFNTRREPI